MKNLRISHGLHSQNISENKMSKTILVTGGWWLGSALVLKTTE